MSPRTQRRGGAGRPLAVGEVVLLLARIRGYNGTYRDVDDAATVKSVDVPFVHYHHCNLGCKAVETGFLITWPTRSVERQLPMEDRALVCRRHLRRQPDGD